jgi:hypothetical protein
VLRLSSSCLAMQEGGAVIRGQNQISHPPQAAGTVDKSGSGPALPAPIRRIFYLSSEGTQQVSKLASQQLWQHTLITHETDRLAPHTTGAHEHSYCLVMSIDLAKVLMSSISGHLFAGARSVPAAKPNGPDGSQCCRWRCLCDGLPVHLHLPAACAQRRRVSCFEAIYAQRVLPVQRDCLNDCWTV